MSSDYGGSRVSWQILIKVFFPLRARFRGSFWFIGSQRSSKSTVLVDIQANLSILCLRCFVKSVARCCLFGLNGGGSVNRETAESSDCRR